MTFGLLYAFSRELHPAALARRGRARQRLAASARCPATAGRSFANLRAYLGFMCGHPGKKLLFMGGEFAQEREWNHDAEPRLAPARRSAACRRPAPGARPQPPVPRRAGAASSATASRRASAGSIGDDRDNSVFAFLRRGRRRRAPVVVVCNLTPVPRHGYRIGVPRPAAGARSLNTDVALLWRQRSRQRGRRPAQDAALARRGRIARC